MAQSRSIFFKSGFQISGYGHGLKGADIGPAGVSFWNPSGNCAHWCQSQPKNLPCYFLCIPFNKSKSEHGPMAGKMRPQIGLRDNVRAFERSPCPFIVAQSLRFFEQRHFFGNHAARLQRARKTTPAPRSWSCYAASRCTAWLAPSAT
jgi:hypothetical protein